MMEAPVFVVVEVVSVKDPEGLKTYAAAREPTDRPAWRGDRRSRRQSQSTTSRALRPRDPALVLGGQHSALGSDSDAYRPLNEIRLASATMRGGDGSGPSLASAVHEEAFSTPGTAARRNCGWTGAETGAGPRRDSRSGESCIRSTRWTGRFEAAR